MAGIRILATVSPELHDEIKAWARARGVSMSSIINLSLQGGFIALKLSVDPSYQKVFESDRGADALKQSIQKMKKKEKKKDV